MSRDAIEFNLMGVRLDLLRDASWMPQVRLSKGWLPVEICLYVALLVLFNAYPHRVGIWFSAAEPASFVPLLSTGFQAYMPWLNVWWSLSLLLALAKLGIGRWTPGLRWADLGLRVFSISLAVRLLVGGPLLGLDPAWAVRQGIQLTPSLHEKVAQLNASIQLGLGLMLALAGLRIVQVLLRAVRSAQSGQNPAGETR